jgi:hypothetical protein
MTPAIKRLAAATAALTLLLAGITVSATETPTPTRLSLPGATAEPTGPGGPTGGMGSGGGSQFQPPGVGGIDSGYSGGNHPAPPQGNGIDINNPATAPEANQAPQYPQGQQRTADRVPVHGTQPPNYDAPLEQVPRQPAQPPNSQQPAQTHQQPEPRQVQEPRQSSPRGEDPPTENPSSAPNISETRSSVEEQRVRKVNCDLNNRGDCQPEEDPQHMRQCEEDPAMPDTALVAWFAGMGGVVLTCGDYFHITREHFQETITDEDRTHFLQCVSKTLWDGSEWSNARPPNIGRKFQNPLTGVWGYVSVRPDKTIATAFTSGDGKDWGGCTRRGLFF